MHANRLEEAYISKFLNSTRPKVLPTSTKSWVGRYCNNFRNHDRLQLNHSSSINDSELIHSTRVLFTWSGCLSTTVLTLLMSLPSCHPRNPHLNFYSPGKSYLHQNYCLQRCSWQHFLKFLETRVMTAPSISLEWIRHHPVRQNHSKKWIYDQKLLKSWSDHISTSLKWEIDFQCWFLLPGWLAAGPASARGWFLTCYSKFC